MRTEWSKLRREKVACILASAILIGACKTPGWAVTEPPYSCRGLPALYKAASERDDWVLDDPSPVMNHVFSDPAIAEPMHLARIADLEGLNAANSSIFTLRWGFQSAYRCITVIGVVDIPSEVPWRSQIRVDYVYHGQLRQAYAYGVKPASCGNGSSAALVIPGSGLNQSSAIASRDPSNYHAGIFVALEGVDWKYVLIKPNEDDLAWHDGAGRKVGGDLIWNWHLNREGSYSVAYLTQGIAIQKWLDTCFSNRVIAGLSQGGAAAMLIGLQAQPNFVVVSSGHSLLFNKAEWAGHNQLIGVPGLANLSRSRGLIEALKRSNGRWLFTYGMKETDIYKVETEIGLTGRYIKSLPNVEVKVHAGGHTFPVQQIQSFLAGEVPSLP